MVQMGGAGEEAAGKAGRLLEEDRCRKTNTGESMRGERRDWAEANRAGSMVPAGRHTEPTQKTNTKWRQLADLYRHNKTIMSEVHSFKTIVMRSQLDSGPEK